MLPTGWTTQGAYSRLLSNAAVLWTATYLGDVLDLRVVAANAVFANIRLTESTASF
jgi:hypothetical protein